MHNQSITLTLPPPVSANRYWAHRVVKSRETGKWMALTYVTAEAKAYKEQVGWLAKAAGIRAPLTGRVHVDMKLYPHRPLDWVKRAKTDPLYWADTVQRLDLDNARKVVYDALKEIAFGDDKCVWADTGHVMEPDGRKACIVVTITPIQLEQRQPSMLETA